MAGKFGIRLVASRKSPFLKEDTNPLYVVSNEQRSWRKLLFLKGLYGCSFPTFFRLLLELLNFFFLHSGAGYFRGKVIIDGH